MNFRGIYALTDDALLPETDLLPAVEAALQEGITMLQYRNKATDDERREAQAAALLDLCQRYSVPLLINDDVDLCARVGAHGVHLGQQDCTLSEARGRLGEDAIIGITCHQSLELAQAAQQGGASYVAFGRFFPSTTKPGAPAANPDILVHAKAQLSLPVVAIGGINADNGASLIAAGADMLAVVGGLFGGRDIARNANKLVNLFDSSVNQSANL